VIDLLPQAEVAQAAVSSRIPDAARGDGARPRAHRAGEGRVELREFDRAFAEFWQGVETLPGIESQLPPEWLLKQVELTLTEEEKVGIQALGGWQKLMKR
jgi:hypothetical protein